MLQINDDCIHKRPTQKDCCFTHDSTIQSTDKQCNSPEDSSMNTMLSKTVTYDNNNNHRWSKFQKFDESEFLSVDQPEKTSFRYLSFFNLFLKKQFVPRNAPSDVKTILKEQ